MAYRVAIVGLGNISLLYDYDRDDVTWTHVKAINKNENFTIIAGIDPVFENRKLFSQCVKAPSYSKLDDFYSDHVGGVDVVVIATSTNNHFSTYKSIVSRQDQIKCDLILLEKPLVSNEVELGSLIELMSTSPFTMVNLFRLYQSQLNEYLVRLSRSVIFDIQVTFSKGLIHNGIHFFTLLNKYFGDCKDFRKVDIEKRSVFTFEFENARASFRETLIDDNSMIIKSSIGSLYYLNGGRHSFFIDVNHNKTELSVDEFNQYQSFVYQAIERSLKGIELNDSMSESFELACKAHKFLSQCETKE